MRVSALPNSLKSAQKSKVFSIAFLGTSIYESTKSLHISPTANVDGEGEREGQRCENGRGSSGRRREGDGYHCAAEIPDVLSNNQPSDCTVGALPPCSVPSLPSLACRFPPQIDLAIGRLAFPQWRGRVERKELEGRVREGKLRRHRRRHHNRGGDKCVVGTLRNTLVRGETNQDFNSQVIHQPEILFPLPSELQFHSY